MHSDPEINIEINGEIEISCAMLDPLNVQKGRVHSLPIRTLSIPTAVLASHEWGTGSRMFINSRVVVSLTC